MEKMYQKVTKDIGLSDFRKRYDDEDQGPPLRRLKSGDSLKVVSQDYVLFNYAPLFLYGGMEHNPVQEWLNQRNLGNVVYFLPLPRTVFRFRLDGFPCIWDRMLWAVEKEFWLDLSLHLGAMAFSNRQTKLLSKVICQEIPVPDMIVTAQVQPNDWANVFVFGVDSNRGCYVMVPATTVLTTPLIVLREPMAETKKLAKAIFGYEEDPYAEVEKE